MAKVEFEHIHRRSPNPESGAAIIRPGTRIAFLRASENVSIELLQRG